MTPMPPSYSAARLQPDFRTLAGPGSERSTLHDELGDRSEQVGDAWYRSIKRIASAVGDNAIAVRLVQECLFAEGAD